MRKIRLSKMNKEIEVEKDVFFIRESKHWSIRLRTKEPYGRYNPSSIYITAIFHKKLDKALAMAWREFYQDKEAQDNHDAFRESQESEIVKVAV